MHLSIAFNRLRNLNAKIRDEPNENFAGERNCAKELTNYKPAFLINLLHCTITVMS